MQIEIEKEVSINCKCSCRYPCNCAEKPVRYLMIISGDVSASGLCAISPDDIKICRADFEDPGAASGAALWELLSHRQKIDIQEDMYKLYDRETDLEFERQSLLDERADHEFHARRDGGVV